MADEPTAQDGEGDAGRGQQATIGALRAGIGAIAAVRGAARQHAEARAQLKSAQDALDESRGVLAHRLDIERNFEQIVSDQGAELGAATSERQATQGAIDQAEEKRGALEGQLAAMKEKHEGQLRPYRDLMETTKGRSDDAAKSLSELKRAIKGADQQVSDAAKRREQRIAAANRSVDNAQERLRKVQSDLHALQTNPSAAPGAISKMQSEAVAEQAHLDAARKEVTRVTAECQLLVDNAQTHLWTQRQSLETVERQADDAKHEADGRREEYERLYNEAMGREKDLSDEIARCRQEAEEAAKGREAAEGRMSAAQRLLDEARDIHTTPELTRQLQEKVDAQMRDLEQRQATVEELAHEERELRLSTRRQRYTLMVAATVAVIVIVIVAITLFLRW